MLTIGICDDNPHFAQALMKKLHELCAYNLSERIDCKVIPSFGAAEEVVNYLKKQQINILFLDIDMPGVNGFKLAEHLCQTHPDTIIIFVSSYEDFVYSSFEYSPFRFLRKAHLNQELPLAFQKVIEKCLLDKEVLAFNTIEGEQLLRIKDIVLFEVQKNYYAIKTTSSKVYKCRGTLNSVEELVCQYDFYRVQSSYIINYEHVSNIENDCLVMKTGETISISRRKLNAFRNEYMKFIRRRITK